MQPYLKQMQSANSESGRGSHGGRWLRWIGIAVAVLALAVLVIAGGAFLYLSTRSGGERVRKLVVEQANATISGKVAVREAQLRGGHLVLRGLVLSDPEGHEVVRVREIDAHLRLPQLFRKRVDFSLLRLDEPVLHFIKDERGSNLGRALALRKPSSSGFGVVLDQLKLERGDFDFEQDTAKEKRSLHLEGVHAGGNAQLVGDVIAADLSLDAGVTRPFQGPFALKVGAELRGAAKRADLVLRVGDGQLVAHARMPDSSHANVKIESLDLPPALVRAFVPSYPLQQTAQVDGEAVRNGDLASAQLFARAGSAVARLTGSFDLAKKTSDGISLRVRHVNLSELTGGGPSSDVAVDLDAAGGGTGAEDATGWVKLWVPPSKMGPDQMGPVRLDARADRGKFDLRELTALVPGLSLRAQGQGTRQQMALSAKVIATDLSKLSRTLGRLHRPAVPMSGSGQLALSARGPLEDPAVQVDGDFPQLRLGDRAVTAMAVHARSSAIKRPQDAHLNVAAREVALAPKKVLRDVALGVNGDGRSVRIGAVTHGYAELGLDLLASIDRDARGGVLRTLSLRYPEAQWRLAAPARIENKAGTLRIGRLELRADRQSIALQGTRRGGEVHAKVAIAALDLSRLPRPFVDPRLQLAGLLDASVKVDGASRAPDAVARVDLRHGRFKGSRDLGLHLDASYLKARARGALSARGPGLQADAKFDVSRAASAPLAVDADIRALPLALLHEAGLTAREVKGTISARGQVRGSARAPRGELTASALGVTTGGAPPLDGKMTVSVGSDVRANLHAESQHRALLDGEVRLGAAPESLRDEAKLAAAPIAMDLKLGPVALADLQDLTSPTELNGTLAGTLTASGTLGDPKLRLRADVEGLGAKDQPAAGDVALVFDSAHAKQTLSVLLDSKNGGRLEVAGDARIDLSYPAITEHRDWSGEPIHATFAARKFDPSFLSQLHPKVERVGGELNANAQVNGTLGKLAGQGDLEWKNGVLETRGYGDFQQIHLQASADQDHVRLSDLSMKSGDGSAQLTASADRDGKGFKLHAGANLDKFPVVSDGQLMANLSVRSSADGRAAGERLIIQKLDIPEAHVQLPDVKRKDLQKLQEPGDIVLTRGGKPIRGQKIAAAGTGTGGSGTAGTAGPTGAFHAVVKVNAPRNLWIQGEDVDTEIGLSDGFRIEYAGAPAVFGDVNILRGQLDVFGRRFAWQKDSKVTFTGPVLEPALDATAVYKNDMEQVTVLLKLTGQGADVQLQPSSEPPLPDTAIYTLLATGHTNLRHGSANVSASGEAASIVGSLAATQLKQAISSVLPLDVFSIQAGDKGLQGTKVEAGTYVNDRLFLGFTGRVGADPMRGENSNEVDLEYQLSKHWSAQGNYGDAQSGGANLTWQKNY